MQTVTSYSQRTPEQNARLHKLIGMLSIDPDHKKDLVEQVSQGRVSSSADLTIAECHRLIVHLQKIADESDQGLVRMRRKIMSICHEIGWTTAEGKVDYRRLNGWLLKYGYLHKNLNTYTAKELPQLVTQFENLAKSVLK
jgi:hypothetical protein